MSARINPAQDQADAAARAMAAGDFAQGRALLEKAVLVAGDNTVLWLNLAACCRAMDDVDAALKAAEGALRTNPRAWRALLMKGALLERKGETRRAAMIYGPASALAPPEERLEEPVRSAVRHARETHYAYMEELAAFISTETGAARSRAGVEEARRVEDFIDISLGRKRNYRQEPSEYVYPGLPAIEFWERKHFPWLGDLEAATGTIRDELLEVLQSEYRDFVPYVDYKDGVPLDQWAQLNHSKRWGAYHLHLYGERVEENCRRCPKTVELLAQFPQPQVARRSPASMFSALQPKTRIPPHTGVANTRLVVHLPLIVPEGCGFRVGNQTRPWREGQAWVFDDTIEHEAWNESDRPRVIMIFDIWNPLLGTAERELVAGVMAAMDKFNGVTPAENL